MGYKQTIDIKGYHGISKELSNSLFRIPQNGVLIPVNNEKILAERGYLNFEIVEGKVRPVNKSMSLDMRLKDSLLQRGIDIDKSCRNITAMCIALGGSRERMQKIAFGNSDIEHFYDGKAVLTRHPEIEEWAKDMYSFLSTEFSQKNIFAFIVTLDVYNPTAYAFIIPIDGNNRFIFSHLFKGLKYQSRSKMMLFHDKVAAVNKKYGLERGDNKYFTFNHNRSSEKYLESLRARKKELDEELEALRKEYDRVVEVTQTAERKVKSLLSMVDNSTAKLNETREQLKSLQTNNSSVIDSRPEIAQMHVAFKDKKKELDFLKDEEARLDALLLDKNTKLSQAQDNLIKIASRKREMQESLDRAIQKIEAMAEDKISFCLYKVYSILVEIIINECRKCRDEEHGFYASISKVYSEPIIKTASLLSLGLNKEAIDYANMNGAKNTDLLMFVLQNDNENEMDWVTRCYKNALLVFK